jgi:hypothetical protein
MTRSRLRTLVRAGAVLGLVALTACTSSLRPNTGGSIGDVIGGVTDASGAIAAVFVEGDRPDAGAGPTATVSGISVMLNGGSAQQTVDGSANYTRVIISVDGLTDYYELTLPAGVASEGLLLTAKETAQPFTYSFAYAVGDAAAIGVYASQAVQLIGAATGDIQVSVSWNDTSDVDLHVIDPNGDEVYFSNPNVASGGHLDIDSNAGCTDDRDATHPAGFHKNNENIVWPVGLAIPGDYRVILDYYSNCGTSPTDWVVTVQHTGASAQIFTGSFSGSPNPVTVTTFTY